MTSVKALNVINSKLVKLQSDVNMLKTGVQGVDILAKASVSAENAETICKTDIVSISEKVAASAISAVKSDCTTIAKVEAGVTVRSMIPTIKAECVNVVKSMIGSGEDMNKLKQDVDELVILKEEFKALNEKYDALLDRMEKPKKAPARKTTATKPVLLV